MNNYPIGHRLMVGLAATCVCWGCADGDDRSASNLTSDGELEPFSNEGTKQKDPQSIYGFNHLQYVNAYVPRQGVERSFVEQHKVPVGALVRPEDVNVRKVAADDPQLSDSGVFQKYCSGTLIGPDLFITAGHCCSVPRETEYSDGTKSVGLSYCKAGDSQAFSDRTFVAFNYELQGDVDSPQLTQDFYQVTEVIDQFYKGRDPDYAVLRLAGRPGCKYGWAEIQTDLLAKGDPIVVIGHPKGRAKQVDSGTVLDYPGWNPDDPNSSVSTVAYDVDTLGGNSGSGILSLNSGKLIGVHTEGWGDNELDNPTDDVEPSGHVNKGQTVPYLLGISSALGDELASVPPRSECESPDPS